MRVTPKLFLLLGFVFAAGNAWSQADQNAKPSANAAEPARYFRLDFVVKETDSGKQVSPRNYSLIVGTPGLSNNGSVRAGDKIPVPTSGPKEALQFTYLDVGVNIDCHDLKEFQQKLALRIQADITGNTGQAPTAGSAPIIRQFRWASDVIVPLRKATVIYQSDAASSKGSMQLELTAIPLQ